MTVEWSHNRKQSQRADTRPAPTGHGGSQGGTEGGHKARPYGLRLMQSLCIVVGATVPVARIRCQITRRYAPPLQPPALRATPFHGRGHRGGQSEEGIDGAVTGIRREDLVR